MAAPCAQAQNECSSALPISVGDDIVTASGTYWYSVDLQAGKTYEISVEDGLALLYASCDGDVLAITSTTDIYTPTAAGTYYVEATTFFWSETAEGKLKIAEVTDNRRCTYAIPLTLGAESPTLPQKSTDYWYKVNLAAGKAYTIEWQNSGSGYFEVYDACEGKREYIFGSGGVYEITTAGTYYICAKSYNADGKFKVSEITNNRICTYATPLALGAESPALPQRSTSYWYKVNLATGKAYTIEWQNSGSGYFSVYTTCDGNYIYSNDDIYEITTAGTYYICAEAHNADDKFKVIEVKDNRRCRYAEVLASGAESPTLPQQDISYWYKVNLTAGKSYMIERTDGDGYGELYTTCGGSTVVSTSDYSPYTVAESGTFYLRLYGYDDDYKIKVSEVTDNRVCSNATPIAVDQEVTISAQSTYWYTIDFVAGRTYNIQWSSGWGGYVNVAFYDACNGTEVGWVSSGNYLAPNSGTYYMRVLAAGSFTITQTDDAAITDNRLCTYAEQVALDETITPPTTSTDYWYTIDLQAGKGYKFEGKAGGDIYFSLHNACGSAELTSFNLWQIDLSELYSAEASGTYYVKVYSYQNGSTLKISEVTIPTVQLVQILADDGISVQKGGTQKFEARVTALGGAAETVTWSVTGGTTGTGISADGVLTIGANETAATLVVTATSTADKTKKSSVKVIVTTNLRVDVFPSTASVAKGSTQLFKAVVTVQGDAAQTVTWSVSGGIAGTSISDGGRLTVAAAETASTLTITATSTADTSKKGTASVTVTAAGSTETDIPHTPAAEQGTLQIYPNPTDGTVHIVNNVDDTEVL
ncbi:hypothetical protein AGMMS49965_24680 [Bacteroidia bacterium]|nr:hypothetical protein AGMMS49965_24680 [Bacteroidia bacterium]